MQKELGRYLLPVLRKKYKTDPHLKKYPPNVTFGLEKSFFGPLDTHLGYFKFEKKSKSNPSTRFFLSIMPSVHFFYLHLVNHYSRIDMSLYLSARQSLVVLHIRICKLSFLFSLLVDLVAEMAFQYSLKPKNTTSK